MSESENPVDVGEFVLHGEDDRDVLISGTDRRPRRLPGFLSGLQRSVAVIATVLAVVIAGGGAVVTYRTLSGGGPQPEKYAPASTFAFAKLDLDPAAGEKISAYRFLKKFPSDFTDKLTSADDIKDALLGEVLPDSANYETDIKPWLGDRVGVAGFLDSADKPHAVAILAVKDHDKAKTELDHLSHLAAGEDSSEQLSFHIPFGYVLEDDYAILATSQKTAQLAVDLSADGDLTTNSTYAADVDSLGGGQIVTAWADLDAAKDALGHLNPLGLLGGLGGFGGLGGL